MGRRIRTGFAINGMLDALATRVGLSLSLAGLLVVCLLTWVYVERSVRELDHGPRVFSDRFIRNGFVTISDIQRLLIIVQDARVSGGMTAENERAFVEAADFLYARTDHFRNMLDKAGTMDSADRAMAALEAIQSIADQAIANEFDDIPELWSELLVATEDARRNLAVFLDEMTRNQGDLVFDQSRAVSEQRIVVLASLAGLTLVGVFALLLLRLEVLQRKAREQAERNVEYLAYYDPLTDLPNRARFHSHLEELLASEAEVTLAFLDLDEFKRINDTYGHAAGDAVLKRIGRLLADQAADLDGFGARLGGDEFALVVSGVDDGVLADAFESLLRRAREGLSFEGETIRIGLSIGFASTSLLGPDLARSLDSLSRVADFALYSSKESGRGRFTAYDRALEQRYLERRSMIDSLPAAIARSDLALFLQPKVLQPGPVTYGFEALVRWSREDRLIQPDEFIKIAEESGQIFELDRFVLRAAIEEVGSFNRRHGSRYSVSVNLSAMHFSSPRVVSWVHEAIAAGQLDPELLTLEITETSELRDWGRAWSTIAKIRDIGARISVDDFGSGYSSLGYLRSTIVDEIKIDRSIVDQIVTSDASRFLLDGVLDIAGNLGLDVVVEGVENEDQAEVLRQLGARRMQGFLFGRPMPASDALAQLNVAAALSNTTLGWGQETTASDPQARMLTDPASRPTAPRPPRRNVRG